jgi:hypothetical protein
VNRYIIEPHFIPQAMRRQIRVWRWLKTKQAALKIKIVQMDEQIMSNNPIIHKENLPLTSLNWQKYRV